MEDIWTIMVLTWIILLHGYMYCATNLCTADAEQTVLLFTANDVVVWRDLFTVSSQNRICDKLYGHIRWRN